MTDEKNPPLEVAGDQATTLAPSVLGQARLVDKLRAIDSAFGVATRQARASGEMKLMREIERRWDDYAAFVSPVLLRVPTKLFE